MKHLIVSTMAAIALAGTCPAMAQSTVMDRAHAALLAGDFEQARTLAAPLADAGDAGAQHLVGYLYEKGLGVRADIGAALRYYGDAAVAGNADAQLALGELAFNGTAVYADYERAAGWFRLAAAQGDARAEVRLGQMYADGVGVARDSNAAVSLFAQAAAKGDADGAFYLGVAWMNGDGVPQNYSQAEKYFDRAAERGHGEAAYHLALIYDSPVLGPPDVKKAVATMQRAVDAGYPPAFAAMGLFAHRGDLKGRAADWFERGARAGDPQAAFFYAAALAEGDGRAQNIAAAVALIDRLIASPTTPAAIRANAQQLRKDIERRTPGPLTLRN